MAMSAATFPPWHSVLKGPSPLYLGHNSPPYMGHPTDDQFSGHLPRLLAMPFPGRCATSFTLRVEARANPRKESAKVRNRRLRRKLNGTPTRPRLSVFCSADQLYAMLIDDQNKTTIFFASTLQKYIRGDPPCATIEAAKRVGEELIKACKELNISEISSYDRNGFARGERSRAFETAISEHGFLPR